MSPAEAGPTLDPFALRLDGPRLVEASAGTGKTYALATLVLRLLLEDSPAGRPPPALGDLLVVTFTRAAAAELRQRIRRRLAAALAQVSGGPAASEDPSLAAWLAGLAAVRQDACRERLRAALRDFDDAAIFTIHGFCQRVLREYAFESGVDFGATLVADESSLRRTAVYDFWAQATYGAPALAVAWLAGPGGLSVRSLEALGEGLASAPHLPRLPPPEPAPGPEALSALAEGFAAAWEAAASAWRLGGAEAMARLAASFDEGALNRNQYREEAVRGRWPRQLSAWFAAPRDWVDEEQRKVIARLSAGRFAVKKDRPEPEHPFFDACAGLSRSLDAADEPLARWGLALRHALGAWLDRELPERKHRAGQQSFDDLLHRLHRALREDEAQGRRLAARIRGRYRAALIDEFQDTDQLQYDIFRQVFAPEGWTGRAGDAEEAAESPPLLLIGDPKQAIYAFRGADVFAYLRAVADLGEGRRHTLSENFRSDGPLVEALAALWRDHPRPFLLDRIPYVQVRARNAPRVEPPGPPLTLAYLPAATAERRPGGKPVAPAAARWAAARAAAAEIGRVLAAPAALRAGDGEGRRLTAGDLAVLVRTNAQARLMQRVLRGAGIANVLTSDASVFDQAEAADLRQMLAAVVDPANARRVRAALVVPALGQDAADLDRLARDEREWERWIDRFRDCQGGWRRLGFLPAFRHLLDGCGAPERLLALVDGERRLTNLLHLAELLHGVASQESLGPEALLSWLDRARADADLRQQVLGDTAQLRLESDAAAVQIATVHKAKGLEYPWVFCPFLWSPSPDRAKAPARFHDLDGDLAQRLAIGPELDEATRRALGLERLAEDLRLLYVALTRARHRLWLACGPFGGAERSALAYLLFGGPAAGPAPGPGEDAAATLDAWRQAVTGAAAAATAAAVKGEDPDTDPWWRRLQALAAGQPDQIAARRLERADLRGPGAPSPAPTVVTGIPGREAEARTPRRPPRRRLHRSSFTALTRAAGPGAPAAPEDGADHDALPVDAGTAGAADDRPGEDGWVGGGWAAGVPAPGGASEPAADRVPLADLVAGKRLGIGLHALLERIDFAGRPEDWRARAEQLAARRALAAEAVEPLVTALSELLNTPLGAGELGFRLAEVPRGDRVDEMPYHLPVALPRGAAAGPLSGPPAGAGRRAGPMSPAAIAQLLAAEPQAGVPGDYPDRLRALGAAPLAGWLSGAMDLVFRRAAPGGGCRWYLVDWKSNRLGASWADYAPERLSAAMAEHHYFLQAQLYTLALRRYLRRQPGFDYDRDFGGVLYLFVRGMRRDQAGSGIAFHRPTAAYLDALDALMGGAP